MELFAVSSLQFITVPPFPYKPYKPLAILPLLLYFLLLPVIPVTFFFWSLKSGSVAPG